MLTQILSNLLRFSPLQNSREVVGAGRERAHELE